MIQSSKSDKFIYNLLVKSLLVFSIIYFTNVLYWMFSFQLNEFGLRSIFIAPLLGALFFVTIQKIDHISIYILFLLSFFLRFYFSELLDVQPFTDFEQYSKDIIAFTNGFDFEVLYKTKSTSTILYYSIFAYLFGTSLFTMHLASSLAWALQAFFLYFSLINFKFSKRTAFVASFFYSLSPGLLFFSGVISSESVFCLLNSIAIYSISIYYNSKVKSLLFFSMSCGFLFITKATAIFYFIPYSIYLLIAIYKESGIKSWFSNLIFIIPFIAILAFQFSLNKYYGGRNSISCSQWGAISLMIGTSKKSKGSYFNKQDLKTIGYNELQPEEVNTNAKNLAIERIKSAPLNFFKLATQTKIQLLYGGESSCLKWALQNSKKYELLKKEKYLNTFKIFINGYYVIFICLFYFSLILLFINKRPITTNLIYLLLFLSPIVIKSGFHFFFNVQERYHLPLLLLMVIVMCTSFSQFFSRKVLFDDALD